MIDRNLELESKIRNIVESHSDGSWTRIILAKENKYLFGYINERTPKLQDRKYKISTKIYWVLNDIQEFPLCQNEKCRKPLIGKDANALIGYTIPFCGMRCSRSSAKSIAKDKLTRLTRYGNKNYVNREKAIQTNMERYGAKDIMQTSLGKEKLKKSIQENYGCDWYTQTDEFQEKSKKAWIEKYGVDNPTKSKEVIENIQNRNLEKYGVKNTTQLDEVKEKIKETCLEKYGVECGFQSPIIKEKSRQTFIQRYGVEHNLLANSPIRLKRDKTCLERYGTKYPIQTLEVKEKLKKSLKAWHSENTRPFKSLYKYDDKKFDSSWELYYYIWLKDHNTRFEFQPKRIIPFVFDNETHYYHPDFLVEDNLVEIKGDQFFTNDGKMHCPWRYSKWSDDDKKKIDALYEAKHQCMKNNSVRILRSKDLIPVFEYIENTYGYNFIEQFKVMS